jgi:hypothetical protein
MPAYGFPDTARLGVVDSNHMEMDSCPAGVATLVPGDLLFSYDGENKVYPLYADTAKTVFSADFVTSNTINGTVDGVAIAQVTYATSTLNTMNLLIAAVNALAGCQAVLDTTDATNRTLLIRKKGVASFVVDFTVAAGASQATDSSTYASGQLFRGVAKYVTRVPGTGGGTGTFAIGEEISVIHSADIWAASASGLAKGDLAPIATNGKFGTSGVSVGARAYASYDSTAVATLIRLPRLPAPMTYGDRF